MIVDANIAVYWFVDSPFSSPARKILEKGQLKAPQIIRLEIANSLLKFERAGFLEARDIHHSLAEAGRAISEFVRNENLISTAVDIAVDQNHKIYDCLYLALALERRDPLATADRRLAALAEKLSIRTELLEPIP